MVNYRRYFLYIILALIGLQLWAAWEKEYPPVKPNTLSTASNNTIPQLVPPVTNAAATTPTTTATSNNKTYVPQPLANASNTQQTPSIPADRLITVETDVLAVTIDKQGGAIVNSKLLKYPEELNQPQPLILLNDNPNNYYVAESGLVSSITGNAPMLFQSDKQQYVLATGENTLTVVLTWQAANGLKVIKSLTFKRDDYAINVNNQIDNTSAGDWTGQFYTQITRKPIEPVQKGLFKSVTYLGGAISSPQQLYEKMPFATLDKTPLSRQVVGGWVAMLQHYFVSAWIPEQYNGIDQKTANQFYSNVSNGLYTLGILGPTITVKSGQKVDLTAKFYTGPDIGERLKKLAPGLDQTVDYGMLWIISTAIFWLMQHIHEVVGNWGWSIVLVTLIIKLIFYKLSATSYRSMAKMRNLQPKIEQLKERHGSDKAKFSQGMMELYRKEKVNPLSGCLPILVQIPVFLALYWVLIESVELRQAPFILWIHDLSAKDPYYVLPLLMGLSMFIQQKMSPAPPDPMQARMMLLLPIIFTVLFMTFPSGLVLYWLVNQVISILQQWYITQKMTKEMNSKTKFKMKKT
jgi:YidC/Oxa1 family membrane protein insertase